jgi:hypothetical protein
VRLVLTSGCARPESLLGRSRTDVMPRRMGATQTPQPRLVLHQRVRSVSYIVPVIHSRYPSTRSRVLQSECWKKREKYSTLQALTGPGTGPSPPRMTQDQNDGAGRRAGGGSLSLIMMVTSAHQGHGLELLCCQLHANLSSTQRPS